MSLLGRLFFLGNSNEYKSVVCTDPTLTGETVSNPTELTASIMVSQLFTSLRISCLASPSSAKCTIQSLVLEVGRNHA